MRSTQQLENGQNAPIIRQSVFNTLMKYCECDTGDDSETIGLSVRNFDYSINFYGAVENNYELAIDEFGHFKKGNWIECKPTESQLVEMKKMLAKEILRVNSVIEEQVLEEAFALEEERTLNQYGHPGAIYGKWY